MFEYSKNAKKLSKLQISKLKDYIDPAFLTKRWKYKDLAKAYIKANVIFWSLKYVEYPEIEQYKDEAYFESEVMEEFTFESKLGYSDDKEMTVLDVAMIVGYFMLGYEGSRQYVKDKYNKPYTKRGKKERDDYTDIAFELLEEMYAVSEYGELEENAYKDSEKLLIVGKDNIAPEVEGELLELYKKGRDDEIPDELLQRDVDVLEDVAESLIDMFEEGVYAGTLIETNIRDGDKRLDTVADSLLTTHEPTPLFTTWVDIVRDTDIN